MPFFEIGNCFSFIIVVLFNILGGGGVHHTSYWKVNLGDTHMHMTMWYYFVI